MRDYLAGLRNIWNSGSVAAHIEQQAEENPHIIESEIKALERTFVRGDTDKREAAANAIATAVRTNPAVGETADVFEVILQHVDSDNQNVRRPLVRSLGEAAVIVSGDAKRQLLANSHVLTRLLDRDDTYTILWTIPAVSRAVREYPDPFLDYVDTIASGLDNENDTIATNAVQTLATIAEHQYKPIKPHVPTLLARSDASRAYQSAEAMRAIALVASNEPSVVVGTDYIQTLKEMHGRDEVVHEQYAARSIGYLLSSEPAHFQDGGLLPLVKQSLKHQNDHIQKDAAIACLRIIKNTDIDLLDDPTVAHKLDYSINQHNLRDQFARLDRVAEQVEKAAAGAA